MGTRNEEVCLYSSKRKDCRNIYEQLGPVELSQPPLCLPFSFSFLFFLSRFLLLYNIWIWTQSSHLSSISRYRSGRGVRAKGYTLVSIDPLHCISHFCGWLLRKSNSKGSNDESGNFIRPTKKRLHSATSHETFTCRLASLPAG